MNSFNFKLRKPVEIAKKGDVELVFELEIRAPTGQNRAQLIRIKQGFFKALIAQQRPGIAATQAQNDAPATANPFADMDGSAVVMLFYMSDVDLPALEDEFKKLLAAGGAFAEGVQLTPYHLDKMDFDDFESLLGEYIKVFIAPSLI